MEGLRKGLKRAKSGGFFLPDLNVMPDPSLLMLTRALASSSPFFRLSCDFLVFSDDVRKRAAQCSYLPVRTGTSVGWDRNHPPEWVPREQYEQP